MVMGIDLPSTVIERAAYSPIEVGLEALDIEEDAYPEERTEDFTIRLDYASSTVYYAVLGVFAGGGYSEKVGDISVSKSGYTITTADRERFKSLADALRKKHGFETEGINDEGGFYDAAYLRRR